MTRTKDKFMEDLYYIGYADVSSYTIGPKTECVRWFCEKTGTQMEIRKNRENRENNGADDDGNDTIALLVKKIGGRWKIYASGITAKTAYEEYFDEELSQDSRFVCGPLEDNIIYLVDPLSILARISALMVSMARLDLNDMAAVRHFYKNEIPPKRATLIGMVLEIYDESLRNLLLIELGVLPLEDSPEEEIFIDSLERNLKENIPLVADYSSILKRITALDIHDNKLDLDDEYAVRDFYREKMNPSRGTLYEMIHEIRWDENTKHFFLEKLQQLPPAS
jgi:hypothetical protein